MQAFLNYLQHTLDDVCDSQVKEAMNYSLLAGGKRIRPLLLLAVLKAFQVDETIGYPCASAIEMIHTYSLIHDDLPAMDNDTLRRGMPTCHVKYGEACAILAGDGLLTQAFCELAKSKDCAKLLPYVAKYAGADGMILGQIDDLSFENQTNITLEQLKQMHLNKTGKLLTLPLICGVILANKDEYIDNMIKIGMAIGLSFQIQDDVLDVLSTSEQLGKNIGSDQDQNKTTYVSLCGIEQAQSDANALYDLAMQELKQINLEHSEITNILNQLRNRNH